MALEIRRLVRRRQRLAGERNLAAGLLVQADHRLAERGFAGAAFANQADDFALVDVEGDVVHRVYHLAAPDAKVLGEMANGHQRVGFEALSFGRIARGFVRHRRYTSSGALSQSAWCSQQRAWWSSPSANACGWFASQARMACGQRAK